MEKVSFNCDGDIILNWAKTGGIIGCGIVNSPFSLVVALFSNIFLTLTPGRGLLSFPSITTPVSFYFI